MIKELIKETESYLLLLQPNTPIYKYLITIKMLLEGIEKSKEI